jgi:hypothetical protein
MIRRLLPFVGATILAACGGGPVQPDWQNNAHQSLAGYSAAYLGGRTRVADAEFTRARDELARTGRADLVARAELVRCAVHVASLEFDDASNCAGFAPLAADAGIEARAYAAFLAGQPADPAALPAQYRALGAPATLAGIEAPLSRLIAAGVLVRRGQLSAELADTAIDTASAQGWRRPLLAWLETRARLAEQQGDAATAAHARRRAALVTGAR